MNKRVGKFTYCGSLTPTPVRKALYLILIMKGSMGSMRFTRLSSAPAKAFWVSLKLENELIPEKVHTWLKENGYGERLSLKPVGGGCINNGMVIEPSQGQTFFLKTNRQAPADMFAREAEGLVALSIPGGPRLPRLLLWDKDFLLLEDLAPAPRRLNYWP